MRKGTIVKAERRQIEILWDGDVEPSRHQHDECVNPADDGYGVKAGMRVERLPERGFRLTGEAKSAAFRPVAEIKGVGR